MSEPPIAVGDLVQVIRSCCDDQLGLVFRVMRIGVTRNNICCVCLKKTIKDGIPNAKAADGYDWPTPWLKRIPPLDELESTRTAEPLREPHKEPA